MIKVPYAVPPSYKVDGDTYGLIGVSQALGYAKPARKMRAEYLARAGRNRPGSGIAWHNQQRAEYYWELEVQWLACAEKTATNARKRLDEERSNQRALVRMEREYGLVCSPESIQADMFKAKP
jgi:hypothetical protein